MRTGHRSRTAEAAAAMRAAHQLLDASPRVLDDPWAYRLLAPRGPLSALFPRTRRFVERALLRRARFMVALSGSGNATGVRRLRAQIVTRSRYAEDRLAAALEDGVDQYVVLGAGLDTFALRRTDLEGSLRVFEVDHPETQRSKRDRMHRIGVPLPAHLELVACDFERQTLGDALARSSYDVARPAIVSWLGVSYYLSLEAIRATLEFASKQTPGSQLILDYWTDTDLTRAEDRALLEAVRLSVAAQGEPMVTFLSKDDVAREARSASLAILESLSWEAIQDRYLADRSDGLRVPEFARLVALGTR